MRQKELTFPVLYDKKGEVFASYGVRGIPMTFIVDAKGFVVRQLPGAVTSEDLEKYLP